ncbi:hypothetical protein H6F78_09210 [Coleofasciculus sp. FACHB-64]|jgi:hypothetical protein|uniref:alr0857 family protein n=1 Tax=Cyanophyceae TaxID=3028117 RepID=UPI0016879DDD|nr:MULTISPECIES: alr0857 family protein [unclassified Coleofasciculus]MBD1838538.1 hypothetical protein [Coleofasciculus sp. FACHB-501]MBD1881104.1 hypothetical protein [Coleofasciculus sp. FACHB-T130]MBD1889217.1 hypothetical protein [Coleofasciculus sp. FACHB-SPT9]MBD1897833.1 hypothetical protein [Coleofasciculus sp. FACHB-129]MBD1900770.1 hypothetical protein [Coleofasciculus sp. FACHB-125]
MLKLTYTENGFYLECLAQSLEEWVTRRVILALRVGTPISVEPSTASFLLPASLPEIGRLVEEAQQEGSEIIGLCACDAEYVEVSLHGSWVDGGSKNGEGVFVTAMSDRAEFFLFKLWQDAQACTSSLR